MNPRQLKQLLEGSHVSLFCPGQNHHSANSSRRKAFFSHMVHPFPSGSSGPLETKERCASGMRAWCISTMQSVTPKIRELVS